MTDQATDAETASIQNLIDATASTPEHAFRLASMTARDESVVGSMSSDGVLRGADGSPAAGAVGVLVDDVLGFALIGAARHPSWSVSVEIALDFLRPLTTTGGLHVTGRGIDIDGTAGFARGQVCDDEGRVLVKARQHGRFLPRVDGTSTGSVPRGDASETVLDLLGAETSVGESGTTLSIADTRPWLNSLGAMHGGVALCAAEAAATCATLDAAEPLRTTSLSVTFGRPMQGEGPAVFETRTLHRGRTLRVVDVTGSVGGRPCTFARVVRQASAGLQ